MPKISNALNLKNLIDAINKILIYMYCQNSIFVSERCMRYVLTFDMFQSGLYAALPYVVMFIVGNTAAQTLDTLRIKKIIKTATARKLANSLGNLLRC